MRPLRRRGGRDRRRPGGRDLTGRRPFALGLAVLAVAFAADRISKAVLIDLMEARAFQPLDVTGFLSLVMVWNRGVSFGMFADGGEAARWLLTVFAIGAAAGLVVWMRRQSLRRRALAMGLAAGGALGNAADRIAYGAVADFFDIHVGTLSWPAFNVADSAIVVGVAILAADALSTPKSGRKVRP